MSDKTVWVSTSRNKVTQDYIILTGSTSKNIELTQEFDDSGKPVIFSGDIKLIEQNPNFYNTTIEENIKMGKNVPKKDIQKALKYSESY